MNQGETSQGKRRVNDHPEALGAARLADSAHNLGAMPNSVAAAGRPRPYSQTLADGRSVQGFLCEAYATRGAEDITALGGWRAWLAARP
jgi:hypothetical protein